MFDAYVLHAKGYQESSLLINLFTQETGILTVIAKGAKRPRSRMRGILQPFIPLSIDYVGKSELKTLTQAEAKISIPQLVGKKAFYGFYINELLLRLISLQDAQHDVYSLYCDVLLQLDAHQNFDTIESVLRVFEFKLLHILGYGLDITHDANNQCIEPDIIYQYDAELGLMESKILPQSKHEVAISGASLLALHAGEFDNIEQLKEIKHFMRACLRPHIDAKPFKTRVLFQKMASAQ